MRFTISHKRVLGLSLVLLVVVCLAAACLADPSNEPITAKNEHQDARARFTAIKLFDFQRFKTAFKKSYASFAEEAARAKLFLGRAFRAFVSAVSYKHRKTSFYLAINQMSDWTPEEVRKLYRKSIRYHDESADDYEHEHEHEHNEPMPAVSADEIERELGSIVSRGQEQPALQRLIAEELGKAAAPGKRRRRNVTPEAQSERQISLDDIARGAVDESSDVGERIESNNPNYEPPEQVSYGLHTDNPDANPMPEQSSDQINNVPSGQFIGWLMHKAAELFGIDSVKEDQFTAIGPDEIFIDHRDECMFAPRDQGRCGSCYAFASIAVYEWLYCKATGKRVALSEQYLVDCGARFSLDGCDGGFTSRIPSFVRKRGLELRTNYPYRHRTDQCPYSHSTPESSMGYLRVQPHHVGYLDMYRTSFEAELRQRPMVMNIFPGDSFQEYGGGVDPGADCSKDEAHAVALVGSGREDNQEYWLIRNSYSVVFGQGGYYKLSKLAKHCIEHHRAFSFQLKSVSDEGKNARYQADHIERRFQEYLGLQAIGGRV